MALTLVTAAVGSPISLAIAKKQLKIGDDPTDDVLIQDVFLPSVVDRAELATQRALLTQTWDLVLDAFPACSYIEVPKAPLRSVTYLRYVDTAGVTQTWSASNYLVQAPVGPRARRGRVALPFSGIWPITLEQQGCITIRFECGYGAAKDVPGLLKSAMLLDLGTLYANREGVVLGLRGSPEELPMGVKAIYWSYKSHSTQRRAA